MKTDPIPSNRQCVIGCVADSSPKYLDQALRLLQSWRWFGGYLSYAQFHVCVVEEVPSQYRIKYERYGAHVHIVNRFCKEHPPSNKLRFLELPVVADADRVILLDCDTLIVQEPDGLLGAADLIAKIADFPTVTPTVFDLLFRTFGISMPAATERCTVHGEHTIPYFNTGVVSLSRKAVQSLVPIWVSVNHELTARLELLQDCSGFCEQASLSLALAASGVTYQALENRHNFPMHCQSEPPNSEFALTDPVILHYHWLVNEQGFLLATPYSGVNRRLDAFNTRLADERKVLFDNYAFWEQRYLIDPELGSGTGSRGVIADYKRALLESIVKDVTPETILDIGCGDMTVSCVLPEEGYTGVDISPTVIHSNISAFHARRFLCGEILRLELKQHDLVICLDVLIHISNQSEYVETVKKIVKCTAMAGVVAAYEEPPDRPSDIIFYHEPISKTLKDAGALDICEIGAYNQVKIFKYMAQGKKENELRGIESPIFVVGAMRSGTTLLADMLGASPHVAHCGFELKDIWSRVGGVPMASAKTRDHYCPECRAENIKPEMREGLIAAFQERVRALTNKSNNAVFLNKNPHLCNKLPLLAALFPDARIIFIQRQLPQVVASLKRLFTDVLVRQNTRHWWPMSSPEVRNRCWNAIHYDEKVESVPTDRIFPGGDVYYLAEYWLESNRGIREFCSSQAGCNCIRVEEEQLIEAPETQLARLYGFLQLPLFKSAYPNLDKKRNDVWKDILNDEDVHSLVRFIKDKMNEMEHLFPGERRGHIYLNQLIGD